jgi:hypothetical protein
MTGLQELGVERDVNAMIDEFATNFDNTDFLAALEIMIDYAQTAKMARLEEMGDEEDDD